MDKVERVKAYQQAVLAKWPKGGQPCQKIATFSNRVSELGSRAWEGGEAEAALVEEALQLVADALGALLAGQEEVHNKLPKVDNGSPSSQRKHPTSPVYAISSKFSIPDREETAHYSGARENHAGQKSFVRPKRLALRRPQDSYGITSQSNSYLLRKSLWQSPQRVQTLSNGRNVPTSHHNYISKYCLIVRFIYETH